MKASAVSRSYAAALYELSKERGDVAEVQAQLAALASAWSESKDLRGVFASARFSDAEKTGLIKALAEKFALSPLTARFLSLLAEKGRLSVLAEISSEFQARIDEAAGTLRGTVVTADVVPQEQVKDLERAFSQRFKKTVLLEPQTNNDLLGGLVVRIGDLSFDGSLRTSLENLKNKLERQYT
jgi:F-type H+-transporting ATPase subunit delta